MQETLGEQVSKPKSVLQGVRVLLPLQKYPTGHSMQNNYLLSRPSSQ